MIKIYLKRRNWKHGQSVWLRFALIDKKDFDKVSKFNWHLVKRGNNEYACSYINKKSIMLHNLIMDNLDCKLLIDHKDRDGLNCQKKNLRIATHAENMRNRRSSKISSSMYLGVSWCIDKISWLSQITHKNKTIYIGRFNCEIKATKAYDKVAKELNGKFANLNFK